MVLSALAWEVYDWFPVVTAPAPQRAPLPYARVTLKRE